MNHNGPRKCSLRVTRATKKGLRFESIHFNHAQPSTQWMVSPQAISERAGAASLQARPSQGVISWRVKIGAAESIGKRARKNRTWTDNQNRNHHDETKCGPQAIWVGVDGPTSRAWIRTPLPGSKLQYVAGLPRKGTPEDRECKFPRRRYQLSLSLRQIVELRMCALSHLIREKPSWWEIIKDKAIIEGWREEALQREEEVDEPPSWKLTPAMVQSYYLRITPPRSYFLISRSTMSLKSSTDTHLCVIQRLA